MLCAEAQRRQNRRVQIVDVNLVFNRSVPQLVGRAINRSASDAAASQPQTEASVVVAFQGIGAGA